MNGSHRVVLITTDRVICIPIDLSSGETDVYIPGATDNIPYSIYGGMPGAIPAEQLNDCEYEPQHDGMVTEEDFPQG